MSLVKKALLLATLPALGLTGLVSCKVEKNDESKVTADSRPELQLRAREFREVWGEDIVVKFDTLPRSGSSNLQPYSGYWYPEAELIAPNGRRQWMGTNVGLDPKTVDQNRASPLRKYDLAFHGGATGRAADWEVQYHNAADVEASYLAEEDPIKKQRILEKYSWYGHCNGFSAAAARHKEPINPVVRNGVTFSPRDIKALLAEIYMSADYIYLAGSKCRQYEINLDPDARADKRSLNACEDVNPGTFHVAISNWVGLKKENIIFDRIGNSEVWNYPLYKFSAEVVNENLSETEALSLMGSSALDYDIFNPDAVTLKHISMTIYYADLQTGGETLQRYAETSVTYEYILELNGNGDIIGGEWALAYKSGEEKEKIPDYVWVPLQPREDLDNRKFGNPFLNVKEVLSIWAESVGYGTLENAPERLSSKPWSSSWGVSQNNDYHLSIDGGRRGAVFMANSNKLTIHKKNSADKFDVVHLQERLEASDADGSESTYIFKPVFGMNAITICPNLCKDQNPQGQTFYVFAL